MSFTVEKLCGNFKLGEAPHWDDKNQILYFVDINGYSIHRYVPATKQHTSSYVGKFIGINKTCIVSNINYSAKRKNT